ncbi:MAG TPA: sulfotransferase [Pirellulales bacterium]|nr:sulfotransferase [Pirellulales bacterium]
MAIPGFAVDSYLPRLWRIVQAETRRLRATRYVSPEWLAAHPVSTEDPIIIGGCGRSGTTMMSVMLNSHSQVYCGAEDALLLDEEFSLPQVAKQYRYDLAALVDEARGFDNRGEFTEFVMRDQKQRRNVSRFATKQPRYALCLPTLLQRFPCARFIYLCRDGRDVAVSFRKNERRLVGLWPLAAEDRDVAHLSPKKDRLARQRYDRTHDAAGMLSMTHCADVWRLYVNAFYPFERDPRCRYVRYEDLVTRPRETLTDLCAFLDLPFEESMLTFHSGKGVEGRDELSDPHHAKVKSQLDPTRLGVWRQELTRGQVREFETRAGRELLHGRYELSEGFAEQCVAC